MSKRDSEAKFGAALRDVDLASFVYRPPDAPGTPLQKPCDWMVWHLGFEPDWAQPRARSTWFECKDVDAVNTFNFSEVRAAQLNGIREARRLGIPYWLAIYWRRHHSWTISDAIRIFDLGSWFVEHEGERVFVGRGKSISRALLMSRFGIESKPHELPSVLKGVLLGEVG